MNKLPLELEQIFLFMLLLCLSPLILYLVIYLSPIWIIALIISFFVQYQESQPIARETVYKENRIGKCYIDNKGYYRFSDSHKIVHRWVVEKELDRKLLQNEVVHHVDGNKLNNNSFNLLVCSPEIHKRIHLDNLYEYNSWHKPVLNYNKSYNKISS